MKKRMMAVMMVFAIATSAILPACDKDDDDDNGGNGRPEVTMQGTVFSPATLQIAPGETATWINNDNMVHTVIAVNGSFNSGNLDPGDQFQYTFGEEGTYDYFCSLHPGMAGTIVVVAP